MEKNQPWSVQYGRQSAKSAENAEQPENQAETK